MESGAYVDVFGQELVGNAVFIDDIVVHAGAGCCRTEKETEESVCRSAECVPASALNPVYCVPHSSCLPRSMLTCLYTPPRILKFAADGKIVKEDTHPPLKAPTGFLTGATTASCLNTALVWNPRVVAMFALTPARAAVRSSCDAIVSCPPLFLFNYVIA
jgi:hypothetical protein